MAEQFDDVGVVFRRGLIVAAALHFAKLTIGIENEGRDRILSLDIATSDPPSKAQDPIAR